MSDKDKEDFQYIQNEKAKNLISDKNKNIIRKA